MSDITITIETQDSRLFTNLARCINSALEMTDYTADIEQIKRGAVDEVLNTETGFTAKELSVLAYANNFTLWYYKAAGESILTPGYFNGARDMLRLGDVVMVSNSMHGDFSVVVTSQHGEVTVKKYGE